jgi:hypothetical protein
MNNRMRFSLVWALALCGLALMSGCMSNNPGSSSLAFIDIESHDVGVVEAETIRVFEDDGYTVNSKTLGEVIFEREATRRERAMFGYYGDNSITMRVVVAIEPRRQGGSLVRADAYSIHAGLKEKVARMARRPYQAMLNRVKANLVAAEGAAVLAR